MFDDSTHDGFFKGSVVDICYLETERQDMMICPLASAFLIIARNLVLTAVTVKRKYSVLVTFYSSD